MTFFHRLANNLSQSARLLFLRKMLYFFSSTFLPSAYTQSKLRFLQFWQAGLSPGHLVFLCRHGSQAWLIRCPRELPIAVALTLLSFLIRLIAIFELSGFTSTYGDEGGAMARIVDGTRGTGDVGWATMHRRKICQNPFEAVFSRRRKTNLRYCVVHYHPVLPIERV